MSQNKRRKMDLGAACSSASVNTQEMSTSVVDDGGEPHIAQQTSRANYRDGSGSSNANEKEPIFKANKSEFRAAVKWTGFVDRSLFIKELLSNEKQTAVIIFAPKRFGKSMNMDMVKCFLEIEGDRNVTNAPQDLTKLEKYENFQAFHRYELKQPCKILAEADFVKEHFGRHPVVHITFQDVKVSSIQDVKNSVRRVVHLAYRAHSYLKKVKILPDLSDTEDARKNCRIWCDTEEYLKKNSIEGLQDLIEYLHAYHNRKVYLLVDEFDAPAVKALLKRKSGDEVKNISDEVTELLGAIVKGETEKHLLGSLITGISYLGSIGTSGHLNNQTVYKWLLDVEGRFALYYGLSHDELTTLLKHVFPNQEQKQKRDSIQEEVKDLYNGYNFRGESIYCLWSVLHYIEMRSRLDVLKFPDTQFWGGSSIISEMGSLLKRRDIMEQIIKLMGDNYISFLPCKKVNAQKLAKFLNSNESLDSNIIYSFFMEQGYFTPVPDQCDSTKQICVKIPNADVLFAFQEMFRDFCVTCCKLSYDNMKKCADVFLDMPTDRDDEICKKKLGDFYIHLEALLWQFDGEVGVNEHSLYGILYTTMLACTRRFEQCCRVKPVRVGRQSGKIDLWVFRENFAIIFEMKHIKSDNDDLLKESAQQALKEILYVSKTKKVPYVKILDQYSNIKNYFLIGISMNNKAKPCICCIVNSRNDKDCLVFPEDE